MGNPYVENFEKYCGWLTKTSRGISFIAFSLWFSYSGCNYYLDARKEAERNKSAFTRMSNTLANEKTTLRSMHDTLKEMLDDELENSDN